MIHNVCDPPICSVFSGMHATKHKQRRLTQKRCGDWISNVLDKVSLQLIFFSIILSFPLYDWSIFILISKLNLGSSKRFCNNLLIFNEILFFFFYNNKNNKNLGLPIPVVHFLCHSCKEKL